MLSVIVPLLDESASLPQLLAELEQANAGAGAWEVLFVDDGSRDDSWAVVERLAAENPRVRGLRFRRNFGKAAALTAGAAAARGEILVTLDADLQDDPAEIPRFLAELEGGLDLVSGWKKKRLDPWHKVWPSRVFNWLVGRLTGVRLHDHNCGFKACRREVFDEVQIYGELHRFLPVLAAARGFRVGEIAVNHRPRTHGRSKYGVARFVKGFLDLLTVWFLTSFEHRPQHLLGTLGLAAFLIGLAGLAGLAGSWVVNQVYDLHWTPLHQRPALIYSLGALLLGAQFMTAGLLAELLTAFAARSTTSYSIRSRVGDTGEKGEPP